MLILKLRDTEGIQYELHVGDVLSGIVDKVDSAQADCDELDTLAREIEQRLPADVAGALLPKGLRVVRWYGDDARFILANFWR